mgnify:CR=1 FL=1
MTPAQWLLSGTAGAIALVLFALASERPPTRVTLAPVATEAPPLPAEAPRASPIVTTRHVIARPSTASELAARAMAALRGAGPRAERYCAAFRELEAVPASQQPDPSVRGAWRAVESAERLALREYQAANNDGRRLLCRDGQLSPSCSCRGPRRGCCSWHGGVRGCEPLPSRVLCPPRRAD